MLSYEDASFNVWTKKGWALFHLKRYEEALMAYDHALALVPDNWAILAAKGFTLVHLQKLIEALVAFDRLLTVEPNNTTWLASKVLLHLALKQYNEALAICDCILTLDPQQKELWQHFRQAATEAQESSQMSYDFLAILTALLDQYFFREKERPE